MKSVCGGCGLTFVGVKAFDKHRIGEYRGNVYAVNGAGEKMNKIIGQTPCTRRCLTAVEIQNLGMVQDHRGWWGDELSDAQREQLKGLKKPVEATV